MKLNKTLLIIFLILLVVGGFFFAISNILLPFVLAFVLAYILNPAVNKLQKHGWNRTWGTTAVVTGFFFYIIMIILILIPLLQTQVVSFMKKVPAIAGAIWSKVSVLISYTQAKIPTDQMDQLRGTISQTTFDFLNTLAGGVLNLLSNGIAVVSVISLLVITPVILFYVLRDWNDVSANTKELVPPKYEKQVMGFWQEVNQTLSGFIRGQISVCFALAVFYAIGLSVVGLDLGVLVGILSGILSFIPYFGFLTGVVLSILIAFSQGAGWGLWIGLLVVFSIGQVLESYVLTPKLVGDQVGLHPVWVIFALLAGGVIFGFLGILLAVPIAAVIGVVVRHTIAWYKGTNVYKGKK